MNKLIPKEVTLESEHKYFSLGEHGSSDGSKIGITFHVPEGMTHVELVREQFEEKEKLDIRVLTMEYAKGRMPKEIYEARKEAIKKTYDQLLKRENGPKPAAAA